MKSASEAARGLLRAPVSTQMEGAGGQNSLYTNGGSRRTEFRAQLSYKNKTLFWRGGGFSRQGFYPWAIALAAILLYTLTLVYKILFLYSKIPRTTPKELRIFLQLNFKSYLSPRSILHYKTPDQCHTSHITHWLSVRHLPAELCGFFHIDFTI